MRRFLLSLSVVVFCFGAFAQRARAQGPCCTVTAINSQTGIVSAKVDASGATFEFKLPNVTFLKEVRVGQGVYANFSSHQVSLNGSAACCSIISGPTAPMTAPAAPKPAAAPSAASPSAEKPAPVAGRAPPESPCCGIVSIDAGSGHVTARVNATGQTFVFTASASVLSSLKVGQDVYANFAGKQVSLDGKSASGTIISGPTAAGSALAVAAKPATSPAENAPAASESKSTAQSGTPSAAASEASHPVSAPPASRPMSASSATAVRAPVASMETPEDAALACMAAGAITGGASKSASSTSSASAATKDAGVKGKSAPQTTAAQSCVPSIGFGDPQPIPSITSPIAARLLLDHPPARWEARTVTAVVAGKSTSANIVHLRGLDGIQQAHGLPDAARDFLIMHIKTLPAGSSDNYVVNLDLANEWAKTHPRIPSAEPTAPKSDGTAGCDKWTWHCAQQAGQHAVDQASQQADELREQADKDWDTATGDAIKVWNEGPACFEPRTLNAAGDTGPLQADPSIGYTLTESGKTSGSGITASGTATGKVNLALPVGGTFKATASVSFIPCLPFAILPTSVGGSGEMTINNKLTASLNASGKFDYDLKVPDPASAVAPKIPLEVIPIVIFGIPICEMDVSLYFEGDLDVSATGSLSANFELDYPHDLNFDFLCSTSSGCTGDISAKNLPITTNENIAVKGQVNVTPDVFVALQLDFDIDALTVRSGPEPKLYGFLNGCYMGSATQTMGGPSSSTEQHLLTGDVDWRLQTRSDFFLLGFPINNPWMFPKIGVRQTHLWYQDLLGPGGSNGLDPIITAPTEAVMSGKPATYTISMPKCDPFADPVTYKIAWTGNAKVAETGATKNCLIGEGAANCTEVPTKPFAIDFTWPSAGSDSITVTPVTDAHGRKYAIPPTQVNVDVQGPPISGTADTPIKQ